MHVVITCRHSRHEDGTQIPFSTKVPSQRGTGVMGPNRPCTASKHWYTLQDDRENEA